MGLALCENITNIKHFCFLLARHCHFQDRNICSVMLSHSLPQPLIYWYCHFGSSICSVTLHHPLPPPPLSLHSSSFCSPLIHFSSSAPFLQNTDKIPCSCFNPLCVKTHISVCVCVFFFSCLSHAPHRVSGITLQQLPLKKTKQYVPESIRI